MKTTIVINDNIMRLIRKEADNRNITISEMVEAALRLMLEPRRGDQFEISPLPVFDLGSAYVNIADLDVLGRAIEER